MRDFSSAYAQKLLSVNGQYLELRESREKYLSQISKLENTKYSEGITKYHYIDSTAYESKLLTSILSANSLEGDP